MALFPTNPEAIVTFVYSPQLIAAVAVRYVGSAIPFELIAYERYVPTHLEIESLIIYNPTRIKNFIQLFLKKHQLHDQFIFFTLQGPMLFEKYVEFSDRFPARSDFSMAELQGRYWDYRYMYPTEYGHSMFYVAGFPYPLIAQYQLLALMSGINVVGILPATLSLLQVYKQLYGAAFRTTQLALDMVQHHNIIDYLCTPDTLLRIISIPRVVQQEGLSDVKSILIGCGVHLSQRNDP